MNRQYISTAAFNAPFTGAHYLSGLGAWPNGRAYYSTANFRAPYRDGYFQDNSLFGLGGFKEDAIVVLRQIPTWAFLAGGAGLSYLAYKAHQAAKKKKKAA
jgi:hypothetical protein